VSITYPPELLPSPDEGDEVEVFVVNLRWSETELVTHVAKMLAQWETSDELATEFAERLVRLCRKQQPE